MLASHHSPLVESDLIIMSEKKAYLFANGELPDIKKLIPFIHPDMLIVAVDGGLHHVGKVGFKADWLIGDLDSISEKEIEDCTNAGVVIYQYPKEKNETDLELAIDNVVSSGYRFIRIAGALGGRLDQTLGNLFLLAKPELADCNLRLEDGCQEVFLIRERGMLQGLPGDIVSLIPVYGDATGVSTEGLRYPLNNETLHQDHTRGISNELVGETASIKLENGFLLCIHTRKDLEVD